jgi:GntR family transcriptional repressor for pyruvate dehydrogenase complex
MAHFGVSRTCLREAMSGLEVQGLIISRHGSGCYVTNVFESHFAGLMSGVELNSGAMQLSIMEMRLILDAQAAEYVCKRATDQELTAIGCEYKAMAQRSGNYLQRAKADLRFHMLMAESSHSLIIVSLSQLLYAQFFNAIYGTWHSMLAREAVTVNEASAMFGAQHQAIYQAVMARDSEAATAAAQAHIIYSMSLLKSRV